MTRSPQRWESSSAVGIRRLRWARKVRAQLIAALGGACRFCGATTKLEFDHLTNRTWEIRRLDFAQRLRRVRQEIAEGKIQLLCGSCNKRKGQPVPVLRPRPPMVDAAGVPVWVTEHLPLTGRPGSRDTPV